MYTSAISGNDTEVRLRVIEEEQVFCWALDNVGWEAGSVREESRSDGAWRIKVTPGSASLVFSTGFFVWAQLNFVLIGLAKAGVPAAFVAGASVLSFVYLGWRAFCAHVSFDGNRIVRIRNGLRSYTVPVTSIVGSAVVCRFQLPPRLALKVERDGRTRVIPLDGTARMTCKGRQLVVDCLRHQTIMRPAVLLEFQTLQY